MRPPPRRARLRSHLTKVLEAGITAADPAVAVRKCVSRNAHTLQIGSDSISLRDAPRLHVIALGKPAPVMAQELMNLLGDCVVGGVVVTKHGHGAPVAPLTLYEGGHPVPDRRSVAGARAVLRYAERVVRQGDHVVVAIGGGASATCCAPVAGVTLRNKQRVTELLLRAGATIAEINAVRKHLSLIKGGRLSTALRHAFVHSLLVSDVIGDDPGVIGSGPTAPDRSTFADASAVLRRYNLADRVPSTVSRHLQSGVAGEQEETAKRIPESHTLQCIATNADAVRAVSAEAKRLGYRPHVLSTSIAGETADVAAMHAAIAREVRVSGRPVKAPVAIISGGETTVSLGRAHGTGGRNQEFVLAFLHAATGMAQPFAVASIGTDGTDGPTDAAGAIGDDRSLRRASAQDLPDPRSALAEHDSYPWFDALGDLIRTGPTGTNVMDLRVILLPD